MNRRDFIKTVGIGAACLATGQFPVVAKGRNQSMEIKAVKLYEKGFMTRGFALGGEIGMENVDNPTLKYRSTLQNFLIDTGKEVILVDTGMPLETPDMVVEENTQIYLGSRIKDYVSAFKDLGYKPEQVTKILVTHKHADHTGELRSFPNAKIYMSPEEKEATEYKSDNIIGVQYKDGAYHNFPASEKIADGVYLLPAKGHTFGNSIIVAESDGLFYMMHGDVTYTDEALYENKLSVVFDDVKAARDTLNKVREFVKNNPTVYCSTHTPLGYENLEAKKVIDLDNPPKSIPPTEIVSKKATGKYICSVCGTVYDPAVGDPEHGIPAGTAFEDLPADWKCPRCKQGKDKFNKA
ncbi:MAG: rubredoxin [Selenomonadaceae bacterium]|nr:rubredoxin [Selenomonadaceae bacterium]